MIPVHGKLRQEDHKFEVSLDYITILRLAWDLQQDSVPKRVELSLLTDLNHINSFIIVLQLYKVDLPSNH
jgi:hypothetical protein